MKAELRADGLHLSGYVNVTGRLSRPVITPRGKVLEVIEQRAFERAIGRASKVDMLVDHNDNYKIASTDNGSLSVKEDIIGLRAESIITDGPVIEDARNGNLKGWSFRMSHIVDEMEERADGLPIRHIKDFDMSEVSIIRNMNPVYPSTSIEVRAEDGDDETVEFRANEYEFEFTDAVETPKESNDYSEYRNVINELKTRGV